MSYCLKTGGLVVLDCYNAAWNCDFHVVGDTVICVIVGEETYDFDEAHVMLHVKTDHFFDKRGLKPYGVIAARQQDCEITPKMRQHIIEHYLGKSLNFANYQTDDHAR